VAVHEQFNALLIQLSWDEITRLAHQPKDMIRKESYSCWSKSGKLHGAISKKCSILNRGSA